MSALNKAVALIAGLFLILGLSACAPQKIDTAALTAIIDVRTPAEYLAGHLLGSINIDVESADFTTRVSDLDPAGSYLVYCHSGRRAQLALTEMKSLGFKTVTNAGGIHEAAVLTNLAISQ